MKTVEGNSICSHAKTIFLSALTNRSADAISALIPKPSFTEISLSRRRIWGKRWQLPCHQLWASLPAPELKPFSKSSMKSAPLALQRGANEANGRILDAWYCKIRLNYVTFTPSYPHPFNILVPLTHLSIVYMSPTISSFKSNLAFAHSYSAPLIHFIQFPSMNVTTLICFSQAMTASVLRSNKAAYMGEKNGPCLCTWGWGVGLRHEGDKTCQSAAPSSALHPY